MDTLEKMKELEARALKNWGKSVDNWSKSSTIMEEAERTYNSIKKFRQDWERNHK